MKVKEAKARELLVAMGVKTAAKCPLPRLQMKLNSLRSWTDDADDPGDDRLAALRDSLTRALEDGEVITVTPEGAKESPDDQSRKRVGILDSELEFLKGSSEKRPVSTEELINRLAERFPDRNRDGMLSTVKQLKYDMARRGVMIKRNEKGFWIAGKIKRAVPTA